MSDRVARIPGMEIYQISKARDRFTGLVKQVQESGIPVEIVRHGMPAVYIVPVCKITSEAVNALHGSVKREY